MFLHHNKKGVSQWLVYLLITIIGFFLIFGIVARLAAKAPETTTDILCKGSIATRANTMIKIEAPWDLPLPDLKARLTPMLCKTQDKKVSGKPDEVMKDIADLMAKCWWLFSEGRYPFVIEEQFRFTVDTCFPCYTIKVGDIKNEDKSIKMSTFNNWLRTHNYSVADTTRSYMDYIQNFEGRKSRLIVSEIKSNHVYYVLYSDFKTTLSDDLKGKEAENGIYFVDMNNIPETYKLAGIEGYQCKIVEDISGK